MQMEAPQRLSTAIIQLPTGDSVVEAMVDLQEEPPAVISWDQVPQLCHKSASAAAGTVEELVPDPA